MQVTTLSGQVKNLHVLRHMGLQDLRLVIQARTKLQNPSHGIGLFSRHRQGTLP